MFLMNSNTIELTMPVALALTGALSTVIVLIIKLGDRLWKKNGKDNEDRYLTRSLDDFKRQHRDHECEVGGNIQKLSDTMNKYKELQEATLRVEEYRYNNIIKQIETLQNHIGEHNKDIRSDFSKLNDRIDNIFQSIKK